MCNLLSRCTDGFARIQAARRVQLRPEQEAARPFDANDLRETEGGAHVFPAPPEAQQTDHQKHLQRGGTFGWTAYTPSPVRGS